MRLKNWINSNRGIFPERDLRFLLKCVFYGDRSPILENDTFLNQKKLCDLEKIKRLYSKGIPLPYILGKEEFFALEFKVTPDTLIPRKETELVTERAIEIIARNNLKTVLDLGGGCGNIAISLKEFFKQKITIVSSDISFSALRIAKENAGQHSAGVIFVNTDLFNGFRGECFDLIVSNPPYVAPELIKGSLRYEPREALEASNDGLWFIEKILNQAHLYLKKEGYLILEIGYNHKQRVSRIAANLGLYEIVEWIKDYSNHWRGVILKGKRQKAKGKRQKEKGKR
ncbi:MAG: peptide chain release factor N(5)-glutamine methyltransferase [Nanoarchaeota archaeon]|nr:peptide chain release factor N(5)-glutamine methyltransferase [Nanoarchaeota archaeon]